MKPKKKQDLKELKNGLVDIEKLKEFGITKDPNKENVEEIDGEHITGGKHHGGVDSVDTHWPTTGK